MFVQIAAELVWRPTTGTRLAHSTSDRCPHDTTTFPYQATSYTIEPACSTRSTTDCSHHPPRRSSLFSHASERFSQFSHRRSAEDFGCFRAFGIEATAAACRWCCGYLLFLIGDGWTDLGTYYSENKWTFDLLSAGIIYSSRVPVALATVRPLYEGTLVIAWTTAPSRFVRQRSSTLVAALSLVLFSLTIAARCYASNSVARPVVQLSLRPGYPDSDSNPLATPVFQTHSSNIVLAIPKVPPSDTSVTLSNSKTSRIGDRPRKRRRSKREVYSNSAANAFGNNDDAKSRYHEFDLTSLRGTGSRLPPPSRNFEVGSPSPPASVDDTVVSAYGSAGGWNGSSANASRVSDNLQVQFETAPDRRPPPGSGIERSMPPAHDHDSNSRKSAHLLIIT